MDRLSGCFPANITLMLIVLTSGFASKRPVRCVSDGSVKQDMRSLYKLVDFISSMHILKLGRGQRLEFERS